MLRPIVEISLFGIITNAVYIGKIIIIQNITQYKHGSDGYN